MKFYHRLLKFVQWLVEEINKSRVKANYEYDPARDNGLFSLFGFKQK